jgi:hypothetical protein
MKAGYHDVPMSEYLSDKVCPEPSMSKGTVKTINTRTMLRAHFEHPRLGKHQSDANTRSDFGSAVHAAVLGGQDIVYVGEVTKRSGKDKGEKFIAEDWKTADAREARDEIRAAGNLPMLQWQRPLIEQAAVNALKLLATFGPGKSEVSMFWQTEGVWCRGRADWLTADYDIDLKTCDEADGATWARKCVKSQAYDIQAALRSLGHTALGEPRQMRWLLVECEPPFECSIVIPSAKMIALATAKIMYAAKRWRECLDSDNWPSYEKEYTAEPSAFEEFDLAERTGVVP